MLGTRGWPGATGAEPAATAAVADQLPRPAPTSQLQLSQGGAGVNNDTLTYNAGLSQDLRWLGGSFWASLDNLRQSTNSNNAFYNPHYNSIWTFIYRQPLLRGFRIDHSRRQLQVAAITRDLTDVDLRATLTNIVSDVHNAYWTYATAIQGVEVARQSLALATQLVADNQTRVTFGTLAQSDVIQAQAEAATRRQALVAAESTRRTAEQALKQLIVSGTDDPHWGATIEAIDRPVFSPAAIDAGAAVRRALRERTDIAIAEKHLELNDVTLRYLRDQTLPQMDMQVTYGLQGVGGSRFTRLNSGVLGSRVTQTIPGGWPTRSTPCSPRTSRAGQWESISRTRSGEAHRTPRSPERACNSVRCRHRLSNSNYRWPARSPPRPFRCGTPRKR